MILSFPRWLDRAKVSVYILATKRKSIEWMLLYQITRSMQRMLMLFRRSWYYMVYMVHCYLSRHFFVLGNDPQRAHKCSESIFLLPAITSLKQQSNHKEYHSAFPVGSTTQWLSLCSEKVFLKEGRCSINFHYRDFQRLHVSFPVVQFPYQKISRVLNLHHLAHRREDPECFLHQGAITKVEMPYTKQILGISRM